MTEKSPRQQLLDLICERSYREGDFTLSSGAKSSYYIDLKPTLLHPQGAIAFGQMVAEWMTARQLKFDAVGGLTLGADPLVMAVSIEAFRKGMMIPAVMIRKEPKKHGTSRYIEGVENLRPGAAILVLEDVVTTGASALKAIDLLLDGGFRPTQVLSVVDRDSGGREAFSERKIPFHTLFTVKDLAEHKKKP